MATDKSVDALSALLSSTSAANPHQVSFEGQGLKLDNPAAAQVVIDAMNRCENMKDLKLEGNTLGVSAAEAIAAALKKHPEFERALWKDMFTGRLKTEIPPALKHLGEAIMGAGAHLVELDLSDNAFGPIGIDAVAALLESPSAYTLQELKFNNQGMGIGGGKRLAKCLITSHSRGSAAGTPLKLRVFIAGRNRLENPGAIALAEAFGRIGTLEEVQMPQNGIYHPGITALSEAFAKNPAMRHINLNDNTFTAVGAKAMADNALPHLKNLQIMNFGDCLVRTEGALALASAVEASEFPKLKEIILSFNEIRKEGAVKLAEVAKSLPSLAKLDINGNQIGEDACEEIKGLFDDDALLGSFSDDEGSDVDEDDDGDDEDDDDEDESDEADSSVNDSRAANDTSNLSIQEVEAEAVTIENVSAADVLTCPTKAKLLALDGGGGDADGTVAKDAVLVHLGSSAFEVRTAIRSVIKLATAIKSKSETHLLKIICHCADGILEKYFRNASSGERGHSEEDISLFTNELLVQLGLLKSEDKNIVLVTRELWAPVIVLDHAIRQPYFPTRTKQVLQVFFSGTGKNLDSMKEMRHQILTTLFSN